MYTKPFKTYIETTVFFTKKKKMEKLFEKVLRI